MGGCASHPKELHNQQPPEEKSGKEQKEQTVAVSNEGTGPVPTEADAPEEALEGVEDPPEMKSEENNIAAAEVESEQEKDEQEEDAHQTGDDLESKVELTSESPEQKCKILSDCKGKASESEHH